MNGKFIVFIYDGLSEEETAEKLVIKLVII